MVLQDCAVFTNATPFFRPPSFSYEHGVWRGRMFMTSTAEKQTGTELQAAHTTFLAATANPIAGPAGGAVTQTQVAADMVAFMSNYVVWANSSWDLAVKAVVTNSLSAMATSSKYYLGR
jgi:hypothetical protein